MQNSLNDGHSNLDELEFRKKLRIIIQFIFNIKDDTIRKTRLK